MKGNSPRPDYGALSGAAYSSKINTPAKNPDYFRKFHLPLLEAARADRPGQRVVVADVACGHGYELEFMRGFLDVDLIGVDISARVLQTSTRERLPDARLIAADVRCIGKSVDAGVADAGIALNAVVYEPVHMLGALMHMLRPGGRCAVNFRIFGNPYNDAFYEYYARQGGKISDVGITFERGGMRETFVLKQLDYRECTDPDIRKLDRQLYFTSSDDRTYRSTDVLRLIELTGFQVLGEDTFHFSSPANPDNEILVYTLQKQGQAATGT
ncbi:class I SAM-dependent methyltransferase [Candidatus Micrarchaeota archaeon]|nr:class I SAM-dependent methyltransferase [Candidatus Micrarchaeota archaeon]